MSLPQANVSFFWKNHSLLYTLLKARLVTIPYLVPVANTENTTVAEHAKLRAAMCQQSGFNNVLQLELDNKT